MLYNRNYGKLNGQSLEYAPLNVCIKNVWHCPATPQDLRGLGYKEIVDESYPSGGKNYSMSWKDTGRYIRKVWNVLPDSEPPTPTEKREQAYQTEEICKYDNGVYTVDYMNKLWYEYSAEGNEEKAAIIKDIIVEAKKEIREKYPDK